MRQQRQAKPESYKSREKQLYWSPHVPERGKQSKLADAGPGDWYAVVDEIIEGVVRFEIAEWPELDRGNHLRFASIYELSFPLDDLQQVVDRARKRLQQPAPNRPLRVGDAFRIQSRKKPGKSLLRKRFRGTIQDITEAARQEAKIAMHRAVSPGLTGKQARERTKDAPQADRFQRARRRARSSQPVTVRPDLFQWGE